MTQLSRERARPWEIMVVSKAAGIKNPSEEGSHSVGFAIIRTKAPLKDRA